MRSALKRPRVFIAGLFIFLFLAATPVYAIEWSAWFQTQFSLKTLFYGAICEIIGCGISEKPAKTGSNSTTPTITYNQPGSFKLGGILGFGSDTMIAMYDNPPTSSTYYLANLGKEFGVSPAYAQVEGSGAGMIRPVEQLWRILRNISYLFFVIIFVAIGFMIMLRQKLNPQTVITVQSVLPSLVIGLILVTFSYFIAALITDFAFFGVQIVAQIFSSVLDAKGNVMNMFDPVELSQKSNIFDLYFNSLSASGPVVKDNYGNYLNTIGSAGSSIGSSTWDNATASTTSTVTATGIGAVIGGIVFWLAGGMMGGGVAALGLVAVTLVLPLIVILVLLIAFTVQFMKLMFKLLMAYIMIMLTTALGPLYITFSLLPGKGGMVGTWWKTLLGNALVFPAVFALFLFAGMILRTDQSAWSSTPPFFGNFSTALLQPIIAFVILLGAPAVPDMVKKAIGASDLGAIGSTGIGGMMAGYGIGAGAVQKGYQRSPIKKYRDDAEKYREAKRARALGIDTHDTARKIEISRTAAGSGNIFQRGVNSVFYKFKPADEDFGRRNMQNTQTGALTAAREQIDAARASRGEGGGGGGDPTTEN